MTKEEVWAKYKNSLSDFVEIQRDFGRDLDAFSAGWDAAKAENPQCCTPEIVNFCPYYGKALS